MRTGKRVRMRGNVRNLMRARYGWRWLRRNVFSVRNPLHLQRINRRRHGQEDWSELWHRDAGLGNLVLALGTYWLYTRLLLLLLLEDCILASCILSSSPRAHACVTTGRPVLFSAGRSRGFIIHLCRLAEHDTASYRPSTSCLAAVSPAWWPQIA